ncbi:MAG: RDD family protein [Candidatus Eremiobacteraeota bacterium]|nr:RDD family protein [Candidatus Eremiobacteraeota bacterium]
MPTPPAFRGPDSLRCRGERGTFVATLLTLPITIAALSWVFQHSLTWQTLTLLLVVAMIYVAFARGRLLGGGLRVHERQFAHVYEAVASCARMLRMPVPHVFVRDDPFVPVVAVGLGEPYAIVFSAQYVEHFGTDELRFLIGRELGHIAAGHTRLTSLLSANGRENAVVSIAFGAWLRKIEYTADRIGLLCSGSLEAALRAIAVSSFHTLGRTIDLSAFAAQLEEIAAEPALRIGEWTAASPYATNRIAALQRFARDPLFVRWAPQLAENATAPPVEEARETAYAGFWRRLGAFAIDYVVIAAIVPAALHTMRAQVGGAGAGLAAVDADPYAPAFVKAFAHAMASKGETTLLISGFSAPLWLALWLYAVALVGLAGQTVGMMILDLRVVAAGIRSRVGFGAAVARYISLIASMVAIVGLFGLFRRIQPFERWSRTRLVNGSLASG